MAEIRRINQAPFFSPGLEKGQLSPCELAKRIFRAKNVAAEPSLSRDNRDFNKNVQSSASVYTCSKELCKTSKLRRPLRQIHSRRKEGENLM